jgi:hypothetical protein
MIDLKGISIVFIWVEYENYLLSKHKRQHKYKLKKILRIKSIIIMFIFIFIFNLFAILKYKIKEY